MYNSKDIPQVCEAGQLGTLDRNPTVGENLELRIKSLKMELERLEESRKTLGPLLNMRIRDIRDAMSY